MKPLQTVFLFFIVFSTATFAFLQKRLNVEAALEQSSEVFLAEVKSVQTILTPQGPRLKTMFLVKEVYAGQTKTNETISIVQNLKKTKGEKRAGSMLEAPRFESKEQLILMLKKNARGVFLSPPKTHVFRLQKYNAQEVVINNDLDLEFSGIQKKETQALKSKMVLNKHTDAKNVSTVLKSDFVQWIRSVKQ